MTASSDQHTARSFGLSLETLAAVVFGKSVAVVGNAASALGQVNDVDSHDVVVRLNNGYRILPEHRLALGSRTDILMVSAFRGDEVLNAAPHVAWMTPKHRGDLSDAERAAMYFYPIEWWNQLNEQLGARPSTGCMAIDLIARLLGGRSCFVIRF
jgi:hypothetical protein